MAKKQRQSPSHRYKKQKNGKGATALAVFLALVLLLLVGGYYFLAWHQKPVPSVNLQKPKTQTAPLSVTQPPAASQISPQSAPDKEPAPHRESYFDTLPAPTPLPPQRPAGNAQLAVIIDDMGGSLKEAQSLVAIGVPLTFAVIPGLRHDRDVAAFAVARGAQVMLHIPMQSKEYPRRRLESNGLLLDYDNSQLQALLDSYFEQIPQAIGANNHMGSAFTEDEGRMRLVLSWLKRKGLFFVDSVTTPASVGARLAHELHLKFARRDVFLDNEQQEAYIQGQLNTAIARAKKNGHAIAICHPHPVTIATLAKTLPDLKQQGISLVFVSQLVH